MIIRGTFAHLLAPGIRMDANWREKVRTVPLPPRERRKGTVPLIGWRAWGVQEEIGTYYLNSLTTHTVWYGPVMRTKEGTVPSSFIERSTNASKSGGSLNTLPAPINYQTHDYGVYAYKRPLLCWEGGVLREPVIGKVELSGVVVEHELGYRAEIATVTELWLQVGSFSERLLTEGQKKEYKNYIEAFTKHYQCPVHLMSRYQAQGWAKWHEEERETT